MSLTNVDKVVGFIILSFAFFWLQVINLGLFGFEIDSYPELGWPFIVISLCFGFFIMFAIVSSSKDRKVKG